jgi:acetyl-CoA/propionyl-CoA carboxylase biotin carboxyl carrier protein
MLRALEEYVIDGPTTLLGFHRALLESPCFVAGETCLGVVESDELAARAQELAAAAAPGREAAVAALSDGRSARSRDELVTVEIDGRRHDVRIQAPDPPWAELARRRRGRSRGLAGDASGAVVSPMQGTVLHVNVSEGDVIEAGAVLCVVEAMKMENEIAAHRSGVVADLGVAPGQPIASGQLVCVLRDE